MTHYAGPLLTRDSASALQRAAEGGAAHWQGSLDLGRSEADVALDAQGFAFAGQHYPWPGKLKDRTLYYWDGEAFEPISRFGTGLIKLVPTEWGAPTFEIDGIKMLPTAKVSPYDDARRKVELIAPAGKIVLDTCGGLGYFAACCLAAGVAQVRSFEKNADVLWLRTLNPWSPDPDADNAGGRLQLAHGDVSEAIAALADNSVDVIFSNLCLQYVDDLPAVFAGFRRVLKPGGLLLCSTYGPETLIELAEAFHAVDDQPHVSRFAPIAQFGDALMMAGFRDPVLDRDLFTLTYDDLPALMQELRALGATNPRLDRRRTLTGAGRFKAAAQAYEPMRRADGKLPSSWDVIYAHAWAPQAGAPIRDQGQDIAAVPVSAIPIRRKPV